VGQGVGSVKREGPICGYSVYPLQQDFVLGRLGEDLARQDDARTDVNLFEDSDVLAEDGDALLVVDERSTFDASPRAELAVLANDRVQHDGVFVEGGVVEHDRLLDAGAKPNLDVGADRDVRSNLGRVVNLGTLVDEARLDNLGTLARLGL